MGGELPTKASFGRSNKPSPIHPQSIPACTGEIRRLEAPTRVAPALSSGAAAAAASSTPGPTQLGEAAHGSPRSWRRVKLPAVVAAGVVVAVVGGFVVLAAGAASSRGRKGGDKTTQPRASVRLAAAASASNRQRNRAPPYIKISKRTDASRDPNGALASFLFGEGGKGGFCTQTWPSAGG